MAFPEKNCYLCDRNGNHEIEDFQYLKSHWEWKTPLLLNP
ncbi:hypothetical protein GXM_06030 [Nostoc sphaeroides CCNUC1]|uniref:Uncharacterized protein n=1 Tax=Nostoc sphaeroides CCNUC1 TaxID=2653204 RepID=A0A5P8W8L9_9NOSO|nr:hypothetical protein GXM_06030 [Nostoc sphaeroides CCNUC1]